MDNASRAIVLAGAVLIAVGIISLSLFVYSIFQNYTSSLEGVYSESKIESFNRFYDAYAEAPGGVIKGYDAVNLYRKAEDDDVTFINTSSLDYDALDYTDYLDDFTYSISARDSSGKVSAITISKNP